MKLRVLRLIAVVSCCSSLHLGAETIDATHTMKNQKILEHRLPLTDQRAPSFLLVLELLEQRDAKILVETGTSRYGDQNFIGDGGSTIIFGDWAHQMDAHLYSVDIDNLAVANAQKAIDAYASNVTITCKDSIEFLKNFDQPIDFLYLDSFDFELNNPFPSQEHHLREIEAAYSKLHKNSVVMIDDCALPYGGKGKLIIAYLLERDWKIVFEGYQVILVCKE